MDPERSMEKLREAILRALQEGDLIPDELMQQLLENTDLSKNEQLRELLDQLIERLAQEGYISPQPPQVTPPPEKTPRGQIGGHPEAHTEHRCWITGKTPSILGFKTLNDP